MANTTLGRSSGHKEGAAVVAVAGAVLAALVVVGTALLLWAGPAGAQTCPPGEDCEPPHPPPRLDADLASVLVVEGQTATNTGTFSDDDPTHEVAITASVGEVTKTGASSGNWSWSLANAAPLGGRRVTITATDSQGASRTIAFDLTVTRPNGKVAFQSRRDGNWEIYTMNPDGTGQTNLTNNPADDIQPTFSPDGRKIAFTSHRDGNSEIYVMNADGSGQTNLTHHAASDFTPTFSPDGRKIAFASSRDGDNEIYVMNSDGAGLNQLTNNTAGDYGPAFSPDGQKIAFTSLRDDPFGDVFVMNALDGTGQTNLTAAPDVIDEHPSYSPDGRKIAFTGTWLGRLAITTMNPDGSGQTRISFGADDEDPSYSPDGQKIAFMSRRDGNSEIYMMNANGGFLNRLTSHPAEDSWPSWGGVGDTTPPETTITSAPTDPSNAASAEFEFSSNESGSSFECSLNGGTFQRCTSPKGYPDLPEGRHTFEVRAIDAAGNLDPTPASHAWTVDTPDATGKIAFVDEFGDIFTINPDGSEQTNLTDSPTTDRNPAFSPDGDRLAFDSTSGDCGSGIFCERDIHVMNQDGTGESNLTQTPDIIESDPAWSPDGNRIAFVVGTEQQENASIWVMNADGSDRTQLTDGTPATSSVAPAWSPNGDKIAFQRLGRIWVMNADGSGQTQITDGPFDFAPDWSPDGTKIVFDGKHELSDGSGGQEIMVVNADGSGRRALTTGGMANGVGHPSWSPDGAKITFIGPGPGGEGGDVWVMNADGTAKVRINPGAGSLEFQPDWQPLVGNTPGTVQFDPATYAVGEAAGTSTITVTRTDASDGAISVDYTSSDGTASAASDYTAVSGTLDFAVGQTSETFTVPILNDAVDEPDETVNLTLSNPTGGATLGGQSTAVLTITDDDSPNEAPTVAVARGGACGASDTRGTINLALADPDDSPQNLTLSAVSSDQGVVPDGNISFGGGTDTSRTLMVTAIRGSGTSTVTVTVSDGDLWSSIPVKVGVGSDANNTLIGTAEADMIFARKGNDTASGQGANDLLCGSNGKDSLSGGEGDDTLRGGDNNDRLTGGLGADHFGGGSGTDTAIDFNAAEGDTRSGIP